MVGAGERRGAVSAAGLYAAPVAATTPATYHVVATSIADTSKTATAVVTVPAVVVGISPASATVLAATALQFAATVTNAGNGAVNWSVQENGGGTASAKSGLYTAPGTGGTYTVVATSVADPSKSASATVSVPNLAATLSFVRQPPASVLVRLGFRPSRSAFERSGPASRRAARGFG